jgi:RHS repeat-associated protein
VNYLFNGGGQIVSVSASENGNTATLASNITYQPFGPATAWTYGNNLPHSRTYDKQNWMRSITTPGVSTLGYTNYDSNGNLQTLTVDGTSDQFTYDAFDQLRTASGDFGTRTYGYDPVGNRTSLTVNGATSTLSYTPNSNRIAGETGWVYTLDANGNATQKSATDGSGAGLHFVYSPHNRLTMVYDLLAPAVPKATYVYNALGQRVQKTANGSTTRYVYGLDGSLLAETDAIGNVQQEYVYLNGTLLALLGVPQGSIPSTYDVSADTTGTTTSAWTVKNDTTAVGGSYSYLGMSKAPAATMAYWNFTLPHTGYYDVYVWWVGSGETGTKYTVFTDRPYYVTVTGAAQTKGTWVRLGNFHFPTGLTSTIRLESQQNTVAKNAYLVADAARMVLTSADAPPNPNYKFVHTDQLGAPRKITDASGAVVWKATYDPFGLAAISDDVAGTGIRTTLNIRFPGQYFDAESGLHYNYFRDYDPTIGEYLESDPIGLKGGLNTYSYALGNPIYGIDFLALAVGEPGVLESFVPVWGSGREAINEFQEGHWGWGLFNAGLAVSDVFLLGTAAKSVCKGAWKTGSNSWRATRDWYGKINDLEPGTPVHHWLIEQNSDFGKLVPDWLKNQPWNLMPMESRDFHNAVHGWGPNAFNAFEAAWHGTPDWAILLWADEIGKSANAAANN